MSTVIRAKLSDDNPYWISKHRYYELKHFCLQYTEWKKLYSAGVSTIKSPKFFRGGNSKNIFDPVGDAAARIEIFSRHMKMVEQTAIETDPELYSYILRSVTEGCSYVALRTYLGIPCGRDYFYERYRKFFWLLDRVRE